MADAAITLVRDNGQNLPLTADTKGATGNASSYTRVVETKNRVVAVLFSDDLRTEAGRMFERQLRARVREVNVIHADPGTAAFSTPAILATVGQAERVIVAVYAAPQAGKKVLVDGEWKNTIALEESQAALLRAILKQASGRTLVVAMGSPYLITGFPQIETYLCTFSSVPVSEISAAKALFGEIPISGRLPVSLPGVAERGSGLDRAAVVRRPREDSKYAHRGK